jgi:hypothetical protein
LALAQHSYETNEEKVTYDAIPTIRQFHKSGAAIRAIVGPVGSGKTTGAAWEVCNLIPWHLFKHFNIKETKFVVVRNTYAELRDTTQTTIFEWFSYGHFLKQEQKYTIKHPEGPTVTLLFRSCDREQDVKKFKSLEVTGYWIDESIEVADTIKRMLKNRIGRYPKMKRAVEWYKERFGEIPPEWIIDGNETFPLPRFGLETTNPPDIEMPTYYNFAWQNEVPGPIPEGEPLANHEGFWQPPRENEKYLRPGYYNDLMLDYKDTPDWIEMYIDGKPGVLVRGKLVYYNFRRDLHQASAPLIWEGPGTLYRGWDNSGNVPAAIVVYNPTPLRYHVLREFCHDKMGIIDFSKWVKEECNKRFPNAEWVDYGDPAGASKFSKKEGGFTSNQILMQGEGIQVESSEQNFTARSQAVDSILARIDGCLIDPSCTRLLNGFLGGYHYKEIMNTGEFFDDPEKNRFSHIHDAFQYVMVRLVGNKPKKRGSEKWKRKRRTAMSV